MKQDMNRYINETSITILLLIQNLSLILIGLMTIVAFGQELFSIIINGTIRPSDVLLLFIYLEVFAIVRAQLTSGGVPLSTPFAIVMLALSRYLMVEVPAIDSWQLPAIAGAMLLLTVSLVAMRNWNNAEEESNAGQKHLTHME